jgi:hypothetical protein
VALVHSFLTGGLRLYLPVVYNNIDLLLPWLEQGRLSALQHTLVLALTGLELASSAGQLAQFRTL